MRKEKYPNKIIVQMRNFYRSLSEKDRRRYAAVEAVKFGYGGITYICEVLGCDQSIVSRGMKELKEDLPEKESNIRRAGGGRKSVLAVAEGLDEAFLEVLKEHTAGSPTDETVKWTNLSRGEIADRLKELGFNFSVTVVDQLLEKHNFCPRKAFKVESCKQSIENRDEQFKNIESLKDQYHKEGNPVMSMDVKKKELIGNFYRDGKLYTTEAIRVNDHDFESLSEGKVVPHGLYDIFNNIGYITLSTSSDTSEFACECIRNWWLTYGIVLYPIATSILLLCDGGGSNSSRHYIFKEDLQKLSEDIGIEIRIAHYPPYTSKYNPIEHRLFPHITRACKGIIFKSVEIVNEVISKTTTSTGLKVFTSIMDKVFNKGRKVTDGFKENMTIRFHDFLPQWNYSAMPLQTSTLVGY